jgi:hypothetical protein
MEAEKFAAHDKWRWLLSEYIVVVLGVITALAAQQSVEYFHDRHQLEEARRELRGETEDNRRQLNKNLEATRAIAAQLDANMVSLRATQGSAAKIGSKLVYDGSFAWPEDGAWQAVKQNGSLGLMPHDELRYYTYLYDTIAYVKSSLDECKKSLHHADAISRRAPDGNLTVRDVEELITATSDAQAKTAYCAAILHYEELGLQEMEKSSKFPPGIFRAEDALFRFKRIDLYYASDDFKRATNDYITAMQGAVDALKAGQDTTRFDKSMEDAYARMHRFADK